MTYQLRHIPTGKLFPPRYGTLDAARTGARMMGDRAPEYEIVFAGPAVDPDEDEESDDEDDGRDGYDGAWSGGFAKNH